ncbi:hypothetical protein O6H91_23G068800 [Diphasiastrum complanatum]|uniref:Uncharacterized protein n=1 Tax=Diphasiastrum complanatum TaxID=34168 RepID=A0ACC2ADT1_DIPCM|nr:hypothetical protein O6H91_23G068800 [Diphasiastrum complanatum]
MDDLLQYAHSPVHSAVARHDYSGLRRILAALPKLAKAGEVRTEQESIIGEQQADAVSAVIDRRDVPGRETPLHLAVRLGDATAVQMLMAAGADWSLQNAQGWSSLQEAVCLREDAIAMIITRHYQPLAWAKWCRRLPRLTSTLTRMRDFYMELTFHFESSVIPFIGRIAPSDTYRIWKKGANLRADMTLAGFDGFRIQRSEQSFLFMGDGWENPKLAPGSLCVLSHKEKEVMNALEGAGVQPSETEIAHEVASMSHTNMYRPGIDVTEAELIPHLTWRRQEKTEVIGSWKARIYDMHHVTVSVKSRKVPGAMSDEELFAAEEDIQEVDDDEYGELLTEEEKQQLETALKMEGAELDDNGLGDGRKTISCCNGDSHNGEYNAHRYVDASSRTSLSVECKEDHASKEDSKKSWFGWGRRSVRLEGEKSFEPTRKSVSLAESRYSIDHGKKVQKKPDLARKSADRRPSNFRKDEAVQFRKENEKLAKKSSTKDSGLKSGHLGKQTGTENEYKKGLRPVLWLTPDFPLKTEELLPLLDILANKVKAVRRLRELLTTKLPPGMFPVKVR